MPEAKDHSKIRGAFNLWEVYEDIQGEFRVRLLAGENGQVLMVSSESYKDKRDATHLVHRMTSGMTMHRYSDLT